MGGWSIKVLFLTHRLTTPSTRYRVLQFVPHLKAEGIECTVEPLESGLARWGQFRRARTFDAVVLQKRLMGRFWHSMLRRNARTLMYEFDDAVMLNTDGREVTVSRFRLSRFARIIRRADATIASNEYLAGYAKKYTDDWRVKIIPNCIDLARWPQKHVHEPPKSITIGWIGSGANLVYLEALKPGLAKICDAFSQVTFKVVCDRPWSAEGIRVQFKPFTEADEISDVLSFDIAVACYPDDAWTMGKSPVKVLSYMAAGLPIVASDVTCVRRFLLDHANGLLVGEPDDWERKLGILVEAWGLGIQLGAAARKTVEKLYSVERVVKGYASIFKSLAK